MSITNEEFADMMPHRIRISERGGFDDYGQPVPAGNPRTYMCLIDDETTVVKTTDGDVITVALTAYTSPIPITAGEELSVPITDKEDARVLLPYDKAATIKSVERHYDPESPDRLAYMVLRLNHGAE